MALVCRCSPFSGLHTRTNAGTGRHYPQGMCFQAPRNIQRRRRALLRVRPPRAFGNVQLALWRSQPVGTPPGRITISRRHMLAKGVPHANSAMVQKAAPTLTTFAAMCWQIRLHTQISLWHHKATPTSTHIRRNMLANRVSHGNPALARKQRIATTNSSHTTVLSTYGAHVHKAWRWPPSASSHKFRHCPR